MFRVWVAFKVSRYALGAEHLLPLARQRGVDGAQRQNTCPACTSQELSPFVLSTERVTLRSWITVTVLSSSFFSLVQFTTKTGRGFQIMSLVPGPKHIELVFCLLVGSSTDSQRLTVFFPSE